MRRNRGTFVLAAWVALLALSAPAASLAEEGICGDVNASGTVTTSDALAVLRTAVGQSVSLQCPAPATPLQTGQTICYNTEGDSVPCAGTGQDAEFQSGVARSFTDSGNGTITDNKTGLTWEKLSDDGTIHDWDSTTTWINALTTRVNTLNMLNFGGHNDWRLPNLNELRTLLNMGERQPATYSIFDTACEEGCTVLTCSCTQSDWYWSSTTYEETHSDAWFIDFYNGYTDTISKSVDNNYVRAVRGGS